MEAVAQGEELLESRQYDAQVFSRMILNGGQSPGPLQQDSDVLSLS